jgi:hypothetical protein
MVIEMTIVKETRLRERTLTSSGIVRGRTFPLGAIVQVDWLDQRPELEEEELLSETTSFGRIAEFTPDFIAIVVRLDAVSGGELLLIPTDRVLKVIMFG